VVSDNLNVLWADSTLEDFAFSYDMLRLGIRETTGRRVSVVGHGQVGIELVGFWDETVIADGTLVEAHPFAEKCEREIDQRFGSRRPTTGSPGRECGEFVTLVVSLSDGAQLLCTAAEFTSDVAPT
jgi:hypothetical protein